jgi:hypothetical protein
MLSWPLRATELEVFLPGVWADLSWQAKNYLPKPNHLHFLPEYVHMNI